jgi:hypothetical protein
VFLWSISSIWFVWFGGATINGTEAEDQAIRQDVEKSASLTCSFGLYGLSRLFG